MPQRPYVVLEERPLHELISSVLADAGLQSQLPLQVISALEGITVFEAVNTVVAHNDRGALRETHKSHYADTDVPKLAAVSARMFQPQPIRGRRQVTV